MSLRRLLCRRFVVVVVWSFLLVSVGSEMSIVRIATSGTGIINIAEVEFFHNGMRTPIRNVTAKLSSTFHQYDAERCIDGSLITFCHSNSIPNEPTWLDLTVDATFDQIILHNRRDCCMERIIYATIEVLNDVGLRWQTQILSEKSIYSFYPKLAIFQPDYNKGWLGIDLTPVREDTIELFGQTMYHFEIIAKKGNETVKLLKRLPILVR